MNAGLIKDIIVAAYGAPGHAVFREFRTVTGYAVPRYIDVVAVGIWSKTEGIKAFEVKVTRGDFLGDVSRFVDKHCDALAISTEFYYVCPWKMIEPSELPEKAGLIYVDSSNHLKTIRKAPRRDKDEIPMAHFQAFAAMFGNKVTVSHPLRFCGKDLTAEDLEAEVTRRFAARSNRELEKMRERVEEEVRAREGAAQALLKKIENAAGAWDVLGDARREENLLKVCHAVSGMEYLLNTLKRCHEELERRIEEIEKGRTEGEKV